MLTGGEFRRDGSTEVRTLPHVQAGEFVEVLECAVPLEDWGASHLEPHPVDVGIHDEHRRARTRR